MKNGVTVSPPCTAADSVTVKVILSPSFALASLMVMVELSSLLIVPVPVSLDVIPFGAFDTLNPTVNVSLPSTFASSVVETVNVSVSPFVPVKVSAVVFSS